DENSTANPDEKRSNTPSKLLSEINNVLHKSVREIVVSGIPVYTTDNFEIVENILLEEDSE
ncbi:hypothetical protein SAMN04488691_1244, partial [Haloferax larsenii]